MIKKSDLKLRSKLLRIGMLLLCSTIEIEAQNQNIKNDVFWDTKEGLPIYSQGGGVFKFEDPKTGIENTIGTVYIMKKLRNIEKNLL